MIEVLRSAENGDQFFRASYRFKEDSHFTNFGKALMELCDSDVKMKKKSELIENSIDNLISWLWADYALLPNGYFTCEHPYDKYGERFYLSAFEDLFEEDTNEYLSSNVGIPMWAEMSIEYIDLTNTVFDLTLEDNWGAQNFVSNFGNSKFLSPEGSAIALIYALHNSADGDLIFNPKLKDIDKHIVQSDPSWYHSQWTYYNWLDFEVTVDKKEIEREKNLIGASYGTLAEEQRVNLVTAAIQALKIKELEEHKVPQYLLALFLNHPATSIELKAQIAKIEDEYIIKIEN